MIMVWVVAAVSSSLHDLIARHITAYKIIINNISKIKFSQVADNIA